MGGFWSGWRGEEDSKLGQSDEGQERRTSGEKDGQMREEGEEKRSLLLGGGSAAPGLQWLDWGRRRGRARGLLY